ncbi:unnamed protein product [Schistocephalus solidus]|uniref:Uncharacterized protein n=1 Tax=Schistocephalus solidus TaxID=70667 RepID=A0A183T4H9_SCHSO|nr:unnamed protein product [Schistocephalus solidus]
MIGKNGNFQWAGTDCGWDIFGPERRHDPSVGTGNRLCYHHVLLILLQYEDLVQKVTVSRLAVHPGHLLVHQEAEEGVGKEQVVETHHWGSEGADEDIERVSPKMQADVHLAIIDALWHTGQTSYDVIPDGKGDTSVASFCLWAATPEERATGTYLLQLTLLRDSGLSESSNLHLVSRQFPSD